jgi:hypothetical protein
LGPRVAPLTASPPQGPGVWTPRSSLRQTLMTQRPAQRSLRRREATSQPPARTARAAGIEAGPGRSEILTSSHTSAAQVRRERRRRVGADGGRRAVDPAEAVWTITRCRTHTVHRTGALPSRDERFTVSLRTRERPVWVPGGPVRSGRPPVTKRASRCCRFLNPSSDGRRPSLDPAPDST